MVFFNVCKERVHMLQGIRNCVITVQVNFKMMMKWKRASSVTIIIIIGMIKSTFNRLMVSGDIPRENDPLPKSVEIMKSSN